MSAAKQFAPHIVLGHTLPKIRRVKQLATRLLQPSPSIDALALGRKFIRLHEEVRKVLRITAEWTPLLLSRLPLEQLGVAIFTQTALLGDA